MNEPSLDNVRALTCDVTFLKSQVKKVFETNNGAWLFDFRKVLLKPDFLDSVANIFFEKVKEEIGEAQICGLEVASIPIITGVVAKSFERKFPMNGFFIRKSRKKTGLLNMIEGEMNDSPIIIVDDILNSGGSVLRQIKVIEEMGKKVSAVYVILRFRDLSFYTFLNERGIKIYSIFTLDDFKDELSVSVIKNGLDKKPPEQPFKIEWRFKDDKPHYELVVPKSAPLLYKGKLFFGSDSGNFNCLDSKTGEVLWRYKVLFGSQGKLVLSSPCSYKDIVYFGAYDGNFYALDVNTGKRKWVFMDADWIGSSPCVSVRNGLVYAGLEFGVWKKKGGLVAVDAITGKKKWQYYEMDGLTHCSPAVSDKHNIVVCGCNDNCVYAFNAKKGNLLWKFETQGEVKMSFSFDEKKGVVYFGSFDKNIYALEIKTGKLIWKFETLESIYSTPLLYDGKIYVASLDKNIYCLNARTGARIWVFKTSARIFASPEVVNDEICIGSNDSRMYLLNKDTGKNTSLCQITERITNKVAYDKETDTIFLPTFANEIYSLKRK